MAKILGKLGCLKLASCEGPETPLSEVGQCVNCFDRIFILILLLLPDGECGHMELVLSLCI